LRPRVSIVSVRHDVGEAVREAVESIAKPNRLFRREGTYLIKPNMICAKTAEEGVTTDLRVIKAIGNMIQEAGATPLVGDCPGSAAYTNPESVFEATGLKELCRREGFELRVLDKEIPVSVSNPNGVVSKQFFVPSIAIQCDGLINAPKLKTHSLTTLTAGVKNFFGLLQGGQKAESHVRTKNNPEEFSNFLVDLYGAVSHKVKLDVLDAIVGMEGEGPTAGTPVQVNKVLASDSALALDQVASALIGWDPMTVGPSFAAAKRGIGPGSLEDVEIIGEELTPLDRPFRKPEIFETEERFRKIRGTIECDESRCVRCGVCVQICPGRAITMLEHPAFDYDTCIQCFCCTELCPQSALKVIRTLV